LRNCASIRQERRVPAAALNDVVEGVEAALPRDQLLAHVLEVR
jgi:hypothetical protein